MTSILCVDGYKNQCLLYEHELSLEGYEVIMASNGNNACKIVETRQPSVIIMDISILSMISIEAMYRIVSKHKDIPLIIYTDYDSYIDIFMSWAADAFIVKSSDLTELKNKIKELLEKGAVAV